MKNHDERKLTSDQQTIYQIKVPGELDEWWFTWKTNMTIEVEIDSNGQPITSITSSFDQAALQGLLRRLYNLGLPLVSVTWLESG